MRRPIIANQQTGIIVGLVLIAGGTYLVYDAYERRGKIRPFLMRVLTVA
jgi:hypothetical protein